MERKKKVLYIEDDRIDQIAFTRLIHKMRLPYDYKVASSVAEARDILMKEGFDVIITDYLLGDGTAFDVCTFIGDTPVIFISGHGNEKITLQAMHIGASDYIVKDHESNYLNTIPIIIEKAIEHKTSEDRYMILSHAVMEIDDGVYITDIEGNITFVNMAMCNRYGYTQEEMTGRHVSMLGEGGRSGEHYHCRKNGELFPVSLTMSVIKDKADKEIAIFGIVHDISLHKKIEETLQTAKETAEEASRSKSDFLSIVSHELRTPLTSIRGFTNIIKKRLEEVIFPGIVTDNKKITRAVEQVSTNLNIMTEETDRLTTLINDVLDLAKIEAGKIQWNLEEIDLKEIFERSANSIRNLFETKGLWMRCEVTGSKHRIKGDRDRLIQVATNLFSNAYKFTDKGGVTYRIITRGISSIRCEVEDTGSGIPEEMLCAVFEKFKQVGDTMTDRPKGTGLGLPICKEIIQHHSGNIWAENTTNGGALFIFELPIETEQGWYLEIDKDVLSRIASLYKTGGEGNTILIVDDNAPIRSMLRQYLEELGYRFIIEASDAREAMASALIVRPDLILMDISMPDYSGYDVVKALKQDELTSSIPVIIVSALDESDATRTDISDYITKTVNEGKLTESIHKAITRRSGPDTPVVMVIENTSSISRRLSPLIVNGSFELIESHSEINAVRYKIKNRIDILLVDEDGLTDEVSDYVHKEAIERDIPVIVITAADRLAGRLISIASDHINKTIDENRLGESIDKVLKKRDVRSKNRAIAIDGEGSTLYTLLESRDYEIVPHKDDLFNALRRSIDLVLINSSSATDETIKTVKEIAPVLCKSEIENPTPLYSRVIFIK